MGRLEAAGPRGIGPGERALFVAEQLAFHQLCREHRAIQADHRHRVAVAGGVDGPGDKLFAGAAFAHDEDGLGRRPDLQDPRPQRLHERAGADHRGRDVFSRGHGVGLRMDQPAMPHGLGDEPFQSIGLERLLDVIESPVPHRLDGGGHRRVRRDHDDLRRALSLAKLDDELDARHARHFQVGNDAIEAGRLEQLQGFDRASAALDLVTGVAQHVGHRLPRLAWSSTTSTRPVISGVSRCAAVIRQPPERSDLSALVEMPR